MNANEGFVSQTEHASLRAQKMTEDKRRGIAICGSTGSIGTQALDVIANNPEHFRVEVLTAGFNADLLIKQALLFKPNAVVIGDESKYEYRQRNPLEPRHQDLRWRCRPRASGGNGRHRHGAYSHGRFCRFKTYTQSHCRRQANCPCQQRNFGGCLVSWSPRRPAKRA